MKIMVDVTKLEADGTITPQQAVQIRRAAAADTGTLAINVIATVGAFAVVAGLLAMRPTSLQVAFIGLGLTLAGALIRKYRQTQLGFLGSSLIVIGAVLLAAGLVLKCSDVAPHASSFLFNCPTTAKWYGHMVMFLIAAAWLLAVGASAQNGLLVVLSVFALAGSLGSSTGYWHASYGLLVREPTVTIIVFGLLGALASYLSMGVLREPYARLARLFALMALLWVNFGFWVGSLWGDHPLLGMIGADSRSAHQRARCATKIVDYPVLYFGLGILLAQFRSHCGVEGVLPLAEAGNRRLPISCEYPTAVTDFRDPFK